MTDIPKIIKKKNKEYKFIREYPTYILYKNIEAGYIECFRKQELGIRVYTPRPTHTKYEE